MTPTPSVFAIPQPAGPNAALVTLVFLALLLAGSGYLWWQVRRSWRRSRGEIGPGPWSEAEGDEPR